MALATQCPHCLTIFRVASDQLKLRGGLVRCGSCRQVFNGNEFLVEPSVADGHYQPLPGSQAQAAAAPAVAAPPQARVPAPPAFSPSSTFSTSSPASVAAPVPPVPTAPAAPVAPTVVAVAPAAAIPPPRAAIPVVAEPKVFRSPSSPGYIPDLGAPLKSVVDGDSPAEAATSTASVHEDSAGMPLLRRASDDAPAADLDEAFRIDPLPVSEDALAHPADAIDDAAHDEAARLRASAHEAQADAGATADADQAADATDTDDTDEPAFVRRAQRKARISHALKTVMMILSGVMVPVLLLQSLYYWRNPLAEAVPQVRPMLNGMCVALHCTVGLPAEIERLSLEANELQVVPPNQNVYALTVVMRNRGNSAQAWPHLELTLNNDDEKAVVRRVFRPRDYLANAGLIDNGIAADSEQQIKLNFELKDALVSGYRIYLFYP